MKHFILGRRTVIQLFTASLLLGLASAARSTGLPVPATKHWTADNGTYSNLL